MASITPYKNKDGVIVSYRFRACVGRDELGKQQFATKTVKLSDREAKLTPKKLEAEMQRQADNWEKDILSGRVPVKRNTFRYFVEEIWWKNHVLNGEHKAATVEFYKNMSGRIVERFGNRDLAAIKSVDVERFLNDLRAEGLSTSTLKHYQNVLRILFKYAETHDLIEKDPMRKVKPIKAEAKQVDFLTPEQAKVFLAALDNAPLRWRCMMTILILEGLRRGEVVGLQWSDIDFEKCTISINRSVGYVPGQGVTVGTPKSKNSIRTLPLSTPALLLLREWKQVQAEECGAVLLPHAYIFALETDIYQPMFPTAPTRWLSRFVKAHNLPDVSPHDLRHTCGSLMLASGEASIKDTQDFLGHEDAKTTLKFYAGTTPETLRKAAEGLAAVLG